MYAVIEDSGTQYRVAPRMEITVDLRDAAPGDVVEFDRVVAVEEDGSLVTDAERLKRYKVKGVVRAVEKHRKVIVGKFLRRKDMHRKHGHRQRVMRVEITEIVAE